MSDATETKTSPTPWRMLPESQIKSVLDANGDEVAVTQWIGGRTTEEGAANAALIVAAVNERESLLAELAAVKAEDARYKRVVEADIVAIHARHDAAETAWQAEREALYTERDRLRDELTDLQQKYAALSNEFREAVEAWEGRG